MPKSSVVQFAAAAAGRALRAVIPIAAACAALTLGAQAQSPQAPACDSALATSVPEDQLLAACTAIIERDPNRAIAYFHRGNLWRRRADMERARADLDQAIRLDPGYAPAFVVRGLVTYDHGRRIADFGQAIALDPKYARAYLYRGQAYTHSNNYARAFADFDSAIALDGKLTEALQARAAAYRATGDADRAIRDYDALIRLAAKPDDALYGRALAYLAKGDAAHAVADAGEAIAADAGFINAYWLRGRLRFATGDFPGAAADLRHMLDQGARDSRVLVWLAAARGHAKTDARSELAAEADKLQGKDWPFPLVEFLLGRRSIDQVMTAAGTPEQRCDAAFHIGQWRIARDERDSAIAYMKAAARDCDKGGVEALVAGAELKRLGQ